MRKDYDAGRGGWGGNALEYDNRNDLEQERGKRLKVTLYSGDLIRRCRLEEINIQTKSR